MKTVAMVLIAWGTFGCGSGPTGHEEATSTASGDSATNAESVLDPDDPSILRRPFTAEQIRDAMVEGMTLDIERRSPHGAERHRWTVAQADPDGVEIEYAPIDAQGPMTTRPRTVRNAWTELRDHATFSAEHSTREETTRETPLGRLDGWVYTVRDPTAGTTTEYFFARSLPGAPVHMRTTRDEDGELVVEMTQLARNVPGE